MGCNLKNVFIIALLFRVLFIVSGRAMVIARTNQENNRENTKSKKTEISNSIPLLAITAGGIMESQSEGYRPSASIGQPATNMLTSDNYLIRFDFWNMGAILTDVEQQEDNLQLPNSYQLSQNYPNPFNPGTTIKYAIPASFPVRTILKIYNILSQEMITLVDEPQKGGVYTVTGMDETMMEKMCPAVSIFIG